MTNSKKSLAPPPLEAIEKALGLNKLEITWLAGDGSDRCYYRIFDSNDPKKNFVLMQLSGADAEALKINGYDWITLGVILNSYGIHTPRLYATLPAYAALIIEDYGDLMLETCVHQEIKKSQIFKVSELYHCGFEIIYKMLAIPQHPQSVWCKRSFDANRLEWELDFFIQNFYEGVLRKKFSQDEQSHWDHDRKAISQFLAKYSKYFCHRDFHSRNIMVYQNQLAMIDFQDARLGSPAYDAVSLIFDSYVPISFEQRLQWVNEFQLGLKKKNHSQLVDDFESSWKATLLQRQLKALGSFGYLTQTKNRGDYLKYVPAALETLDIDMIYDKRWPFISKIFLMELKKLCNR